VSVIWRKPVLTYAVSVVSLTASVNSVNKRQKERKYISNTQSRPSTNVVERPKSKKVAKIYCVTSLLQQKNKF